MGPKISRSNKSVDKNINKDGYRCWSCKLPVEIYEMFTNGYLKTNHKRMVDYFIQLIEDHNKDANEQTK